MKKIFTYLLGLTMLLIANIGSAQNKSGNWCFTDEQTQLLQQQNPALIQQQQDLEDYILNFSQTYDPVAKKVTIIIPVVVHNITHDGGIGYVSKATIEAQINKMTTDYKALNADLSQVRAEFQPYIATMDVEFRLAHLDPNGNCTEGIVRAESPYSYNTSVSTAENVKAVSYWNSKKYFNIWVIDEIQDNGDGSYVAGYAQFPSNGINNTYGVVCVNQNFSGSDRTMTHEVGHCLSLLHTFQGNCGSTCQSSGDYCCDTPPTSNGGFDCSIASTCSNDNNGNDPFGTTNMNDQFENYMSYSSCTHMFSLDQKTRMMATLNSTSTTTGLAQLWTPSNLAATGVADPYDPNPICVPLGADFSYNKQYLCEGDVVTFSDLGTYNATPTLWDWTFTGGTPNVSNVEFPVITYNTAGTYGATYSPGTTAGYYTPAVTKNNIITVSSIAAQFTLPFTEGMENTTNFNNDWTINTISGNAWQNVTTAAYSGSRSLKINNLANSINDVSEAISSSLDLTTMTSPVMTFKLAYAKKVAGGNDQLIIYSSIDCGASWQIVTIKSASTMSSAPATDVAFTPTGTSQWKNHSITISAGLAAQTNVRFKFYFKNNGGNNVYLDDINISGTVGIDEPKLVNNLTIFPNPTTESAALSFNLITEVKNLKITLKDVLGKEVTKIINGQPFSAGRYSLSIDQGKKLASGLYFIEFNADNKVSVEKLVIR